MPTQGHFSRIQAQWRAKRRLPLILIGKDVFMPTATAPLFSYARFLHRAQTIPVNGGHIAFPFLECDRWGQVLSRFASAMRPALRIMTLLVAPLLLAAPVQAADIFTVNSTVDEVDANLGDGICRSASGKCTLRAAVMQASRSATGATINLPAGTYQLSLPVANGEQGGDLNFLSPASGNPEIRVVGAGRTVTTIYSHGDRAVTIHGGRKAYLADLSIVESGRDSTESCNGGGAICNLGFLGLQRASLSLNRAYFTNGGAIYNVGTLILVESELADNSSWYSRGGAIYNTGFMAIQDSSITYNSAFASGGAIHSEGTLDINRTTIANNYATSVGGYGGGITSGNSDTRIKASTLAFNRADKGHGGGLALYGGSAVFINSTVVGNRTRGDGGGIFSAGNLQAYNTTIAYNETQIDPAPGVYASGGGDFRACR